MGANDSLVTLEVGGLLHAMTASLEELVGRSPSLSPDHSLRQIPFLSLARDEKNPECDIPYGCSLETHQLVSSLLVVDAAMTLLREPSALDFYSPNPSRTPNREERIARASSQASIFSV